MNKIKKIIYIFLSILIFFSMANFSKANVNINIPSNFASLERAEKIKVLKKAIIQIQARIQEILNRVSASSNQEINFESILRKYKENINRNVEISSFYDLKNSFTYYGREEKNNSSSKLYVKKDVKNDKISAINYREVDKKYYGEIDDEYHKIKSQINFIFDDNKIFWTEKGEKLFFSRSFLERNLYKKNQWYIFDIASDKKECSENRTPVSFLPPLLKFLLDEKEFVNSIDKIILNNKKYNIFKTKLTGKKEKIDGVDAYEVNISFSDDKEDIKKFIIEMASKKFRKKHVNFINNLSKILKNIKSTWFKIWITSDSQLLRIDCNIAFNGYMFWIMEKSYNDDSILRDEKNIDRFLNEANDIQSIIEFSYKTYWKYTNKDFDIKFPENNNVVSWLDITNCHESLMVVPPSIPEPPTS